MNEKARGRTALALSAGGLYCAWQAGAYKAVEEFAPPDIVVGASAGALNGWPIAGGCSADRLIEYWRDRDTSDVLRLKAKPGMIDGYFDPEPLCKQTERMVAEFEPRVPFGLTLVEVPRFRTVLIQYPHITARHLQASCAIPFVLGSVVIDGVRYIDGGLIHKVPLRAAADMGATRIIAVDCMPPLDIWWLRLGGVTIRMLKSKRALPPGIPITTITPSEPLGPTRTAAFWERENIERWIALGFRDATAVLAPARTTTQT